jgi:hypothetical protein
VAELTCRPHRPKPKATHRSPTAMFASLECQAGLRTHERTWILQANHLPTSMTQWLRIADTRLPLRGQRRVWFWSANRTGFPFHSPQLSVNTKNSGKAPDNFSNDANCRPGEWQAANIEVLLGARTTPAACAIARKASGGPSRILRGCPRGVRINHAQNHAKPSDS